MPLTPGVQDTTPVAIPRLEGHERAAGPQEVEVRRASCGALAVDSFARTEQGEGPLSGLLYEMRRIAANAQARRAAERVAARDA
jgi:hypothetical protein